ncbi:MAG: non-canonical purine NTP pyrophosphatase [Holophagales bacterium]|nr:non-canonical purine NTP pyrophosphatase [Holophagales bacterium]
MRPSLDSLVFLTSNAGKAREASALLGRSIEARALEIPEIQSLDFAEVVTAKALAAVERLGIPVLVEDSGLVLPAWKGYPGPFTKYAVGAVGEAGFARLAWAWGDPRAEAVSTLALAWPGAGSEEVVVAEGRVAGSLAAESRGANGFGWDVIFFPEGETRTFAEMSAEEKNGRSHRARAFAELVRMLAVPDRLNLG